MMDAVFLGQQSWAVTDGNTLVLVDPVLTKTFGTSPHLRFAIHPPRTIDIEQMPAPSAVVITNEHLDHFHLHSLMLLQRGTEIIVGDLFPEACRLAIRDCGLNLSVLENGQAARIKSLSISLYRCAPSSKFWEKRVCHAVIMHPDSGSIIIQSDGLLSEQLIADSKSGLLGEITLFVGTNNAQIPPPDGTSTYDNLLPLSRVAPVSLGVDIFHDVLCVVPQQLGYVPHLALCGGGYRQIPPKHGGFRWSDAEEIQSALASLSLAQRVHLFLPGQGLRISRSPSSPKDVDCRRLEITWVERHSEVDSALPECANPEWFKRAVFGGVPQVEIREALLQGLKDMDFMAPVLLSTPFGQHVSACHQYLAGPVGRHRFAIRLYNNSEAMIQCFGLNITDAKIESLDLTEDEVLTTIPFGIDIHLADWLALNQGMLQIWELATARMRQWFMGVELGSSPVAFLYCFFSEQVRPNIARQMYQYMVQVAPQVL